MSRIPAGRVEHEHRAPFAKPVSIDDRGFKWPCSVCRNPVHEQDAFVGEWSCERCDYRAVAWVACSQRCMDRLYMRTEAI